MIDNEGIIIPEVPETDKLPMSMSDLTNISDVVETALRAHIPSLEKKTTPNGNCVYLENPLNGQKVKLIDLFSPMTHAAVGYKVWTLEAIPELLAHLLQPRATETSEVQ